MEDTKAKLAAKLLAKEAESVEEYLEDHKANAKSARKLPSKVSSIKRFKEDDSATIKKPKDVFTYKKRVHELSHHKSRSSHKELSEVPKESFAEIPSPKSETYLNKEEREEKRVQAGADLTENLAGGETSEPEFEALNAALEQLAHVHRTDFDEMLSRFNSVSGDLKTLQELLEGKDVVVWNPLEDLVLSYPERSKLFKHLLKAKGRKEINKRKAFLEIN